MKITITFREVMDKYNWDKLCELKGYNPYMMNEGQALDTDTVDLTVSEFKLIGGQMEETDI